MMWVLLELKFFGINILKLSKWDKRMGVFDIEYIWGDCIGLLGIYIYEIRSMFCWSGLI